MASVLNPDLSAFDHDVRQVARGMALLWTFRTRAAIHSALKLLGYYRENGDAINLQGIKEALEKLQAADLLVDSPEREGLVRLADELRAPLYADLLAETMAVDLQRALFGLEKFRPEESVHRWPIYDRGATAALFRLAVFSGTPAEKLRRMADNISQVMNWDEVLVEGIFAAFDGDLLKRVDPEWRWEMIGLAASQLCVSWQGAGLPAVEWAVAQLESGATEPPDELRFSLVEVLVHQGEAERARAILSWLDGARVGALEACLEVQAGHYPEAQAAFELAIKERQTEVSARKRLFPLSIAWFYPLSLLAQHTPDHLETARKFCLGEAGERSPDPNEGWGRWTHAISTRLGDAALEASAYAPLLRSGRPPSLDDLWRLLLAAWLGPDTVGIGHGSEHSLQQLEQTVEAIRKPLRACRFLWLESQLDRAATVLRGGNPVQPFFIGGQNEAWRQTLAALQALGREIPSVEEDGENSRLLWTLRIGIEGALEDILVFEQTQGSRGWSKPRPASLARIASEEALPAHDARVARAIRPDRENPRRFVLDRALAILALVDHPAVFLADNLEQSVELVEGQPEIEVVKEGDNFLVRVTPRLREENLSTDGLSLSTEELRERETLRTITLIQDSPQRVRFIRLSSAQRRASQLVGEGLRIPGEAKGELQKTLRALAHHFQVQGEHARAGRQVDPESRLRAELSPVGENLLLRLVVAPLGPDGPRLAPGEGRSRLMATIGGDPVSTRRDLAAERAHLESVLDALNFLAEPDEGKTSLEWVIEDPEAALDLVERLPELPAVASLDWPKGRHIKLTRIDHPDLKITVSGERDWFRVDGQVELEEGRVLKLRELLAAARGKSRFIPMGEGTYAALTRSLKRRLVDLGLLTEDGREGDPVRLPRLASAWLEDTLEGMEVQADEPYRAAVERLRTVQEDEIKLPKGLQAELRPYQEEGYRWAMRLSTSGFGACLADDMGLGKTLQALAVLLARANGGPALILAPTSVSGNWRAEAERFTPHLNVRIYGEGNRAEALADLKAGDVVIASYTLFQMDQEHFAKINWHTVIADEAQAIKNAAAKRSQAAFELSGDFKLALSGTPVENRLAELWSIMHFANPGLLGSLSRFNEAFANPIEKHRNRHAQQLLRRLVAPFILRRTKPQVLQELPPRTELVLSISPDPEEAAHYEAMRREAVDEANQALTANPEQARINILAQLTKLRRAACDPRLVNPDFQVDGAKVQAFGELAEELRANGHKALVFSQFVDFLHLLEAPLAAAGIPYQYLDGATPANERTQRVAAFQAGEGDFFLISLKAGGFGLNLTAADYVVITDPWWNPAAEDQAMGRAHRMGQKRPVTVYRMVTQGTVEERIVELHQDKRALADSMLAEGELGELPSLEDMVALLGERVEPTRP